MSNESQENIQFSKNESPDGPISENTTDESTQLLQDPPEDHTGTDLLNPSQNKEKDNMSFLRRLKDTYPPSILFFFALCAFNGGIGCCRCLCTINIYKEIFMLEPSQVQTFDVIF